MNNIKIIGVVLLSSFFSILNASDTIYIDVNLDVMRKIDTITSFDRNKFVSIHADITEGDWEYGTNAVGDLRDDFLNGYDVYMGRNTGVVQWPLNNTITVDPSRPGYANPASITSNGSSQKTSYANKTIYRAYENRNDQVLCNQQFPFYPSGKATNKGWAFSQVDSPSEPFGTASGEFYGRFIRDSYGTGGATGQAKPKYIEIINEPLWPLRDWPEVDPIPPLSQVFEFHNAVADQVKAYNPNVLVGGYVTAFPDFEKDNFGRWNERWKAFMDTAGAKMDFWSIHLYDFGARGGKEEFRKGSNMEATFDMMEQYSYLKFGYAKPFLISEYGSVDHDGSGMAWSPYHDWIQIKSVNSMMLQFMERPNLIAKAINYIMIKAYWYDDTTDPTKVWGSRLMRYENEPVSKTGNWVYTDLIKIYQLWSDVKGTRVDTRSNNPDIMTDAYINGNKVYLIVNNLDFETHDFKLNIAGTTMSPSSIKVKELYGTGYTRADSAIYKETIVNSAPSLLDIKSEGTYIIEYTYPSDIVISETSIEEKLYATTYLKEISANSDLMFSVDGAIKGTYGEAVLRIGMGRNHGLSLTPTLTFNGVELKVPSNYRGVEQVNKSMFFGVIEVPVPYDLLKSSNSVILNFPDDSGFVTTLSLRTSDVGKQIKRSDSVISLNIYPNNIELGQTQERQLTATILPAYAIDKRVTWTSDSDAIATVDENGKVTGKSNGTTTITATSVDGGFTAKCTVEVVTNVVPVLVDTIIITPAAAELIETMTLQLSYEVLPIDADDKSVTWGSSNASASVSQTGLVTAISKGAADITILSSNGKTYVCPVNVLERVEGTLTFDDKDKYLTTDFEVGKSLPVSCNYVTSTGETVKQGIEYKLVVTDNNENIYKGYTSYDNDLKGNVSGSSAVTVSTLRATPSNELPSGQFYKIILTLEESDGNKLIAEVYPVNFIAAVGIEDTELEAGIYPNPANSIITIESEEDIEAINIFNTVGSLVLSTELIDNTVNIRSLPEGVYILEISNNNKRKITKLVIQR